MGETHSRDKVNVTVLEFRADVGSPIGKVAGVLVKTCATAPNVVLSWRPWTLVGPDSERYGPRNGYYSQAGDPGYPDGNAPLAQGECVKGWIQFDASGPVTKVKYTTQDGQTSSWKIS